MLPGLVSIAFFRFFLSLQTPHVERAEASGMPVLAARGWPCHVSSGFRRLPQESVGSDGDEGQHGKLKAPVGKAAVKPHDSLTFLIFFSPSLQTTAQPVGPARTAHLPSLSSRALSAPAWCRPGGLGVQKLHRCSSHYSALADMGLAGRGKLVEMPVGRPSRRPGGRVKKDPRLLGGLKD